MTRRDAAIESVCRSFNVAPHDVLGKGRTRPLPDARHVAMYAFKVGLGMSHNAVGRTFGRDHATVVAGVKKIRALKASEPQIANAVQDALESIGAARDGNAVWVVVDSELGSVRVEGAYKSESTARLVKEPEPWVKRTLHCVILDEQ